VGFAGEVNFVLMRVDCGQLRGAYFAYLKLRSAINHRQQENNVSS
jgi:hypothetical protein